MADPVGASYSTLLAAQLPRSSPLFGGPLLRYLTIPAPRGDGSLYIGSRVLGPSFPSRPPLSLSLFCLLARIEISIQLMVSPSDLWDFPRPRWCPKWYPMSSSIPAFRTTRAGVLQSRDAKQGRAVSNTEAPLAGMDLGRRARIAVSERRPRPDPVLEPSRFFTLALSRLAAPSRGWVGPVHCHP